MGKYDSLRDWLQFSQTRAEVSVPFKDIEILIGADLPASATRHRAWWANDPTHVHALAWLDAGWMVDAVDQPARQVRFRRTR